MGSLAALRAQQVRPMLQTIRFKAPKQSLTHTHGKGKVALLHTGGPRDNKSLFIGPCQNEKSWGTALLSSKGDFERRDWRQPLKNLH